jgi:hypothetical protein
LDGHGVVALFFTGFDNYLTVAGCLLAVC